MSDRPSNTQPTQDAPDGPNPQGAEREDATPSDSIAEGRAAAPATTSTEATEAESSTDALAAAADQVAETNGGELPEEVLEVRHGMFGIRGTGDTSGYGRLVRTIEFPGVTGRPYAPDDEHRYYDDVADRMGELVPNISEVITKVVVHRGEITFHVARAHLLELVQHLRDDAHLRFEFCSSVSGVHYPTDSDAELHVVYHLQSMTHNRRIRLEVSAPDADPHVPSVVSVYPTADWHERETWDMFGMIFDGHPALTRILMPDDWPGHPQRKDYPLGGIPVEYAGATIPPPDQRRSYSS